MSITAALVTIISILVVVIIGEIGHQLQPRTGRVDRIVSYPVTWFAFVICLMLAIAIAAVINRLWYGW